MVDFAKERQFFTPFIVESVTVEHVKYARILSLTILR